MRKQTKLVAVLSAAALLAVGASMTSFAATRNPWVDLGDGDWAYVNSDGERVTSEWRRNGNDYYFLDENGVIARSRLITPDDGDGDAYYYVSGTGARLKNQWVRVMNDEQESVNDQIPEMFWYYLRANGKAVRADEGADLKKMAIDYNGKKRTFFFDADGRMVTGWIELDGDTYYCDPEGDGSAVTDWQQLEVPEDWSSSDTEYEYDAIEYFYFDGNGKMKKGTEGKPKVWYNNGWYYSFDANGILLNDWYKVNVTGTTSNVIATSSTVDAFTTSIGTKSGTGWIYTDKNDDGEYDHYYLVAIKENVDGKEKTVRNVPFNSINGGTTWRAKTINGKVYVFDEDGVMQSGVEVITRDDNAEQLKDENGNLRDEYGLPKDYEGGAISRELKEGIYYFNDGDRSTKGQMMTGKQTITDDGETFTYYFNKQTGAAECDKVVDGVLYGHDGKRIQAENGNAYDIVTLDYDVDFKNTKIPKDSQVIVSSTGKLRTTGSGYVKVDGVQYKVKPGTNGSLWTVEEKPED